MLPELERDLMNPFMYLSIVSAYHCRITCALNGRIEAREEEGKIERLLQSCPEPILLS